METKDPKQNFTLSKRIIVLIDLAGFAKASQSAGDLNIAAFLQDYYTACDEIMVRKGGTVIKFMGDACLATFPPEQAKNAVEALLQLQPMIKKLAEQHQITLTLGANLHLTSAVEAEFGLRASRRRD